jgi:hypothetical protein
MNKSDEFFKHLDICEQCREHPFDLCPKGAFILAHITDPVITYKKEGE